MKKLSCMAKLCLQVDLHSYSQQWSQTLGSEQKQKLDCSQKEFPLQGDTLSRLTVLSQERRRACWGGSSIGKNPQRCLCWGVFRHIQKKRNCMKQLSVDTLKRLCSLATLGTDWNPLRRPGRGGYGKICLGLLAQAASPTSQLWNKWKTRNWLCQKLPLTSIILAKLQTKTVYEANNEFLNLQSLNYSLLFYEPNLFFHAKKLQVIKHTFVSILLSAICQTGLYPDLVFPHPCLFPLFHKNI